MNDIKKVTLKDGKKIWITENEDGFIEVDRLSNRWKPDKGERYCYIMANGFLHDYVWNNSKFDRNNYNENNCFKTLGEASRKQDIINYLYENSYEFSLEEYKDRTICSFCIGVSLIDEKLFIDKCNTVYRNAKFNFKSGQDVKKAIEFIGYDDYVKYVLGVY